MSSENESESQVADDAGKPVTPPPEQIPRVRLANSRAVRRLLARLAEQTWSGKIDVRIANALTYQLSTAAKVINDEQLLALAKRVAALEERAGMLVGRKAGGTHARPH